MSPPTQLICASVFSYTTIIIVELLGETRKIRIIILIIIIRAGTPLGSHSFNFNWKPKCNDPKISIFWIPAKVEGITDKRGTSADYYYY